MNACIASTPFKHDYDYFASFLCRRCRAFVEMMLFCFLTAEVSAREHRGAGRERGSESVRLRCYFISFTPDIVAFSPCHLYCLERCCHNTKNKLAFFFGGGGG